VENYFITVRKKGNVTKTGNLRRYDIPDGTIAGGWRLVEAGKQLQKVK
jgi:hypothetical protein